jgi:N-acetyl-gamma-glutamyl-phosphate reductase
MSIRAIVLGGAGYVGGELLRLLNAHPEFRLFAAASTTYADQPIAAVFPHLAQAYEDGAFTTPDKVLDGIPAGSDVALFSAAPHGASAGAVASALRSAESRNLNVRVVDSSADFRYEDAAAFGKVYGIEHPAPGLLDAFACGVPEHVEGQDRPHAGHPGCFATAALLAAVPLVDSGSIAGDLFLSGVTGSTGSGRSAKPGTHHPERHSNLYAYNPLRHRHAPEIENLLRRFGGDTKVHFVPHSGPFARGIHMTLQARLETAVTADALYDRFAAYYAGSPFVHIVDGTPRLKDVVASNFAHIGIAVDGGAVSVMCVIDNLVKGAAGGALQWMNRLWSLPEESGLLAAAPAWT